MYASIQVLLNEWRKNDTSNLNKTIEYEGKVASWLLSEKLADAVEEIDSDVDTLVVKIMTEKLNKKYMGELTPEQRNLVRNYVFSLQGDNPDSFKKCLNEIRKDTISNLANFKESFKNEVLLEKVDIVLENILKIDYDTEISDETIAKFLTISHLKNELQEAFNNETIN